MEKTWRIPKNIRQVGETNAQTGIYIEDYVVTLIHKMTRLSSGKIQQAILIGNCHIREDKTLYEIRGIVPDREDLHPGGVFFAPEPRQRMLTEGKNYFNEIPVVGYAVFSTEQYHILAADITRIAADLALEKGENAGKKLLIQVDCEDETLHFYIVMNGILEKLEGYFIYYEQNEEMQNYLIHWNKVNQHMDQLSGALPGQPVGLEGTPEEDSNWDADMFEPGIKKNGVRAWSSSGNPGVGYGFQSFACCVLAVVCALGIINMNNYEKIARVQSALQTSMERVLVNRENQTGQQDRVQIGQDQTQTADSAVQSAESGLYEDLPVFQPEGAQTTEASETGQIPLMTPEGAVQSDENVQQTEEIQQSEGTQPTESGQLTEGAVQPETTSQNSRPSETDGADGETLQQTPVPTVAAEITQTPADIAQVNTHQEYVVAKGDTLISISRAFYGTAGKVSEICTLNGIIDADTIREGQKIILP